jgi:homoserine O-acetyltransferase
MVERARKTDANDRLYQLEASSKITTPALTFIRFQAPLLAINFEDDELNPPQLGVLEKGIAQVSQRAVCSGQARDPHSAGHYTSLKAIAWKSHLNEFLNTIFLTEILEQRHTIFGAYRARP